MKLLLVEDDQNTILYLQKGLAESGFVVDVAEGGESALHLADAREYDLVILDVMLPGRDVSCAPKMSPLDDIESRPGKGRDEEAIYGRTDRSDFA